ncbi:hypothetical protein D3C73_1327730 [compost metagenome]
MYHHGIAQLEVFQASKLRQAVKLKDVYLIASYPLAGPYIHILDDANQILAYREHNAPRNPPPLQQ